MSENIKNCPFCGSSISVERVPLKHYKGCVIFEIKCLNCGCERSLIKNDSIYRTEEEARANAIAQWNERHFIADVKHEMSAVEFVRAFQRMCEHIQCCPQCPLYGLVCGKFGSTTSDIDKAIATVEKWTKEHNNE